jgi:hypothetical protein
MATATTAAPTNGGKQIVATSVASSKRASSSFLDDLLHPFSLKLSFFLYSAFTFLCLTAMCYHAYGYTFLYETYLYHITRIDTRHNFSVYFYQLYLEASAASIPSVLSTTLAIGAVDLARVLPLLSFLPQLLTLAFFSARLYRDLPLCIFASTLVFVAFNKVVTAQYFLWWIIPLIVIAPQSRMGRKGALMLGAVWMATEVGRGERMEESDEDADVCPVDAAHQRAAVRVSIVTHSLLLYICACASASLSFLPLSS